MSAKVGYEPTEKDLDMTRATRNLIGLGWVLAVMAVFAVGYSASAQTVAQQELTYINGIIKRQDYQNALSLLFDLRRSDSCLTECQGECHFLAGLCRYELGQQDLARDELEKAIRFRPKYELPEAEYADGFAGLYRQVQKRTLCSLEIRLLTPQSLGLRSEGTLKTVYRDDHVPVGSIELIENEFSRRQKYRLNAGQLNVFELKLEELHDYWAFDSLHLMFRPNLNVGAALSKSGQSKGDGPCTRIGRRCFELLESNYETEELTRVVVGDGGRRRSIGVLLTTPEWKKLHQDLAANANRRRLAKIIKVSSLVGTVAATAWAVISDSKAGDKYEEYVNAVDRVQISALYRTYEDLIEQRNILTVSAIGLAAVGIAAFIFSPGDEQDVLDEFERRYGNSGIAFGIIDGGPAVQLKLGV